LVDIGKTSLEIKRKIIEQQTEQGLYPYSANYLRNVKKRTGEYWHNHFSTIGIVGMNEALQNFMGKDLTTQEGQTFALEVMQYLRQLLVDIQDETGHVYNLEATPAEGTAYRLARLDKAKYPEILAAGNGIPYYTNSTALPVGYTDDVFETLNLQDELQSLYTGGTVLHLYMGESIEDVEVAKRLIQKVFDQYKLPYLSLTPTFSICANHGYIRGEHFECPQCGGETEVWSRVTGYLRPVANYNDGKKQEYKERKKFVVCTDPNMSPSEVHADKKAELVST
jgi:ribonucleoside-triphosphate reductase